MKPSLFTKSLLGVALSTASLLAIATPLDLDTSFSGDGMLTANYGTGGTHTYLQDVEITPDDKIIAVGYAQRTDGKFDMLLVKYNLDGSLDNSFGSNGTVNLLIGTNTRGEALAIQPDGKLIVAGHSLGPTNTWGVFVKRFNVDGSIDPSFIEYNYNPTVLISSTVTPRTVRAKGIALTTNGKILVSMTEHHLDTGAIASSLDRSRLVQLNAGGSLDTSFGTNGLTDISHHSSSYEPGKFALSPTGDIYVPGRRRVAPIAFRTETMKLTKYDIGGNWVSFGGAIDGWERRSPTALQSGMAKATDKLTSALVLPDGNVISVGCIAAASGANHHTARIQRTGDNGYGLVAVDSPIGTQHSDTQYNFNNSHPAVINEHCFRDVTYHPSVGIIAVGGIANGSSSPNVIPSPTWGSLATSTYTFTPASGGAASTLNATAHVRRGTVDKGYLNAVAVTHGGKIVSVGYMDVPGGTTMYEAVVQVTQGAPLPNMSATDSIGTLSFTDETDVAFSAPQSAFADNNITTTSMTGFTAQVYGGTAEVNNLAASNPITLVDGDNIALEHTSASTENTKTSTAIVVNNGTGFHRNNQTWSVGDTFAEFNSTTFVADTTPDAFTIASRINGQFNSVITSSTTITGITVATPISISNGEYRINSGAFTSTAGTVENNDTVTVRNTNSALPATTVTSTLTVGGVSADFESTTENADTYPNAFTLQPNVATLALLDEIQTSQTVTISNINTASPVSITNGEYSINGGSFTSASGTVNPADTITVRHTSSGTFSTAVTSSLDVGGRTATFVSTTETADTTPDAFNLLPANSTPAQLQYTSYSTTMTVAGINSAATISIVGGTYKINNGGYVASAGTVNNGDRIIVRHFNSNSFSTQTTSTLTIGGVSNSFSTTTIAEDISPQAFFFSPLNNAPLNATVASELIFVLGINSATPISVTNGEFSINGGTYTNVATTVTKGQNVRVRHTTPGVFSIQNTTTLNIGGVTANFVSNTVNQDTIPDGFSFGPRVENQQRSVQVFSDSITVAGINSAAAISVIGGEYKINNNTFTSANGTVNAGDNVILRQTTASDFSSFGSTDVTIGGLTRRYETRTIDRDITPDTFTITEQTNVELSAVITSAEITITGINDSANISITDGEYSINGGSFTSAAGTLVNGDTVTVRHTSSAQNSTNTTTQVSIGGVTSSFQTTTVAVKGGPAPTPVAPTPVAPTPVDPTPSDPATDPVASSGGGSGGGSMNFLYLLAAGLFFGKKRKS